MKKNIVLAVFLVYFSCFLLSLPKNTLASSSEVVQKLRGDILKLLTQNSSPSLKKDIFSKILNLSYLEAKNIKEKLTKIQVFSPTEEQSRQNSIAKFDQFLKYLKSPFLKNGKILLEEKAKAISSWRKNEYLPYFKQVSSFFIILKAEKISQISKQRMARTKEFLKKQKNTPKFKGTSEKYLNKAQILIDNGMNEIYKIRDLFLKNPGNEDISLKSRLKSGVEKIREAYNYFLKL